MKTFIFIIFLVLFGLFVWWRMSIVKSLVVPQSPEIQKETEEEVQTQTDKYTQPLDDILNNSKNSYDSVK